MSKIEETYPHFVRAFHLDAMISPRGDFIPFSSPKKGSRMSQVNSALKRIHREGNATAYVSNKIREMAALLLMKASFPDDIFHPADPINDVLYGVDAIWQSNKVAYAVDFTENPDAISKKLGGASEGLKYLYSSVSDSEKELPFRVVYIHSKAIRSILSDTERYLAHHQESGYKIPMEGEIINFMKIRILPQIQETDIQVCTPTNL